MKLKQLYYAHVFLFSALGSVIACSPTNFTPAVAVNANCASGCVVNNDGTQSWDELHKIGTGKVDILFVNDNSASMAVIQNRLAQAFGGFVERLDYREIDYRIAMTTTDATKVSTTPLISFGNNSTFLTKNDSNRISLFNGAIVRQETVNCEEFIKASYNSFGSDFQSEPYYQNNYNSKCASGDERGILTANYILKNNVNNFVRSDAHLNVILISNEDVRSGDYMRSTNDSNYKALATEDRGVNLTGTINASFPGKYWEFNSIITKDNVCANQQQEAFFVDKNGNGIKDSNESVVKDQYGDYVIGANPGMEYAALSASASQDIDGNAQPRGQIIDICQTNYSNHFLNMAAKVTESARMFTLECSPLSAPVVEVDGNPAATVPHTWNGNQITFNRGYEGIKVRVKYTCPQTGGVQ